jgi:hypothetical protein
LGADIEKTPLLTRPPNWLHTLRLYPWLFFVLSAVVVALLCGGISYGLLKPATIKSSAWASAPGIAPPYRLSCPGPGREDAATHLLLVSTQGQAQYLLDTLCPQVATLGLALEAYWGLDDDHQRKLLKTGAPAIVFGRAHLVQSEAVNRLQAYQEIGRYPPYPSNLVARSPIDVTRIGLAGKRIGLVANQSSLSGHLVPKAVFRAIGLQDADYTAVFADSHKALRVLLSKEDVDAIATYWGAKDRATHPTWAASEMSADLRGPGWYIRPDITGSNLSCVLRRTLTALALDAKDPYYRQLEISADDCQ